MSSDPHDVLLRSCHYSENLQKVFASLSGDYNPLHVDPVVARRTLIGSRAVHGIHQTLSAMEALLAWAARQNRSIGSIAGFKSQFLKPVLVEETVDFSLIELTGELCRITGKVDEEAVCKVTVQLGSTPPTEVVELPSLANEPVVDLSFPQLTGQAGSLILGLDPALADRLFPLVTKALGNVKMAETLALSRLVGMHCPGLHSMFGQADVRFDKRQGAGQLNYRVKSADERFGRVIMVVDSLQLKGELLVYFRPPPVPQADMDAVSSLVKPGSFADSVALIVGGSRGLGEITAKIIGAGGGLPFISYHQGEADASRVVEQIRSKGGRCEMLRLDVQNSKEVVEKLATTKNAPKSLYYFATPKIPGRQRGFFSHDMLREYVEVYVTAFGHLVDTVAAQSPAKLRVLYPSTVMVAKSVKKMEEYAMAKRLGEEMCSFYNQNSQKVEIIVKRLPRLKTDQTSALVPLATQNALEVMLPIIRAVENVSLA